ncbi:ubiquitin carboxyl-terminal hydrolase 15-like [Oncorhynchus keta]|uniref:ubiquitin carboxyl-terminal hydrolase 15-like n=1 Tax=Oncorhynchus keta TaxID=8018 RepID=UPI0015FD31A1|nr:ubiquitin carboxyl-terminal hydrolase 15-like [Oncorhynchus keta]
MLKDLVPVPQLQSEEKMQERGQCSNKLEFIPSLMGSIIGLGNVALSLALLQERRRYLVDSHWFKQWKKYVVFDSWDKYQMGDQNVYPGSVEILGLLTSVGDVLAIKEHLIDDLDYILIPPEGWNKLVSWYALMEGHEAISRKVVEQGMFVKHCKVEVYLTELKLCEDGNIGNVVTRRFRKAETIDTIEKEMRKLFSIPDEKETRLWNKYMSNTFEPLNKLDSTIQDAGLYQGQVLMIDVLDDAPPKSSNGLQRM